VDIFTAAVYDGDRELQFHRRLENYPVLAPEGAIIPLDGESVLENGGGNPSHMEVLVVVGANGEFELLEDDGMGSKLSEVSIVRTPISFNQGKGALTLGPVSSPVKGISARQWTIRFIALEPERKLTVSFENKTAFTSEVSKEGTCIHIPKVSLSSSITISLGSNPQLAPTNVVAQLYPIVDDAQIEFWQKKAVWNILTAKGVTTNVRISRLNSLNLPPMMLSLILEYVLADERSTI